MTIRRPTIGRRLHRVALRCYRILPMGVRRALVRTFAPSYTVGALCVIARDDGRILLVRQLYRDGWGIPGGLVSRGELPAEAARREVFEEVGIAIELVGAPTVVVDPGPRRVDVVHRARPVAPSEVAEARPVSVEIVEVGWFDPSHLPELQDETAAALAALASITDGVAGVAEPERRLR